MTKDEVKQLKYGLYRIYWKSGGCSLASVGGNEKGDLWYAPINWVSVPGFDWSMVKRVSLVTADVKEPKVVVGPKYDEE